MSATITIPPARGLAPSTTVATKSEEGRPRDTRQRNKTPGIAHIISLYFKTCGARPPGGLKLKRFPGKTPGGLKFD